VMMKPWGMTAKEQQLQQRRKPAQNVSADAKPSQVLLTSPATVIRLQWVCWTSQHTHT
jgi:hypothetical protein